jgi:hypothetical protein
VLLRESYGASNESKVKRKHLMSDFPDVCRFCHAVIFLLPEVGYGFFLVQISLVRIYSVNLYIFYF